MVMVDLQNAFDTVSRSLLSDKLQALEPNKICVSCFDSYLTSLTQKVDINGTFSKPRMVPCVVPQGSILGQLILLIYVVQARDYLILFCYIYNVFLCFL